MSILEQLKELWGGAVEITRWLRAGGRVVGLPEAQERADVCNLCPQNSSVGKFKIFVAWCVRKILEIKNDTKLEVRNSAALGQCKDCGCVLKILILEQQDRIEPFLTLEDRKRLPQQCWKMRKP